MKYSLTQWLTGLIILVPFLVLLTPLVYIAILFLALILPPFLLIAMVVEKRDKFKIQSFKDLVYKLFLIVILLPMGLLAFLVPVKSLVVFGYRFYQPFMNVFNEMHKPVYDWLRNLTVELAPLWLDFYLGLYGTCVLFCVALVNSIHRNKLVSQIRNLATSKVHAAAIGVIEIKGKAVPADNRKNEPIMHLYVETTADGMHGIRTITKPFYIDDGTGRILVDPGDNCTINSEEHSFGAKLHHAVLKTRRPENGFAESMLMPDDDVYVLGNLQINPDKYATDKVLIKPQKSSLLRILPEDLFFVSNKGEAELLDTFNQSIKPGWMHEFILIMITVWLAIYSWTNIQQIQNHDIEAVNPFMKYVSWPTELQRKISVPGSISQPAINFIKSLNEETDTARATNIIQGLANSGLVHLVLPDLMNISQDIDHPLFGIANQWLGTLDSRPGSMYGYEYFGGDYWDREESVVLRVLLYYREPSLFASFRANCQGTYMDVPQFTVSRRSIVFEFTNRETDVLITREIFCPEGIYERDDLRLFEYFLPGEYEFRFYTRREYTSGSFDKGSRNPLPIGISIKD